MWTNVGWWPVVKKERVSWRYQSRRTGQGTLNRLEVDSEGDNLGGLEMRMIRAEMIRWRQRAGA